MDTPAPNTELLFPPRHIATLRSLRGVTWQQLVDSVLASGENSAQETAFVLMLAKLSGCITCNSSTYRAMNGCANCSRQTIKRQRGSDEALVEMFEECFREVKLLKQVND
jgi:hypothetical protein